MRGVPGEQGRRVEGRKRRPHRILATSLSHSTGGRRLRATCQKKFEYFLSVTRMFQTKQRTKIANKKISSGTKLFLLNFNLNSNFPRDKRKYDRIMAFYSAVDFLREYRSSFIIQIINKIRLDRMITMWFSSVEKNERTSITRAVVGMSAMQNVLDQLWHGTGPNGYLLAGHILSVI